LTAPGSRRGSSECNDRERASLGESLTCGRDPGSAVSKRYGPPFEFIGTLYEVTVDVSGTLMKDSESAMRIAMARQ
jgi:arylsulfatase